MSVASSISNALARFGRRMVLRRGSWANGEIPLEVTINGVTEGYAPAEIVNGLTAGSVKVTFSNKEIADAAWPGPPAKNDRITIDGIERIVLGVEPKYLASEILVFVCEVSG